MDRILNERELKINSFSELISCIFGNYPHKANYFAIPHADLHLLTSIMLNGSQKLFGHVDPTLISEKQFALLQEYMESIGYHIKYKIEDKGIKIWFEMYTPKIKCNGFTYN